MTTDREQERRRRTLQIFESALEIPEGERARFLADQCGEDPGLLEDVRALLRIDSETQDFELRSNLPDLSKLFEDPAASLGERVGGYRILDSLGEGGFGRVFRAEQDHPRRTVALKVLRHIDSECARMRFRFESEILARLAHPGIAQVYDAGLHAVAGGPSQDREVPYFAMEFVPEARDLLAHAVEEGLDLGARLELFAQVCDAVGYGHRHGVIHRDLTPRNILVDGQGRPKVIDFGLARSTREHELDLTVPETRTGDLLGTLRYMSPEQLASEEETDTGTDVYALGVILYELVCGAHPFDFEGKTLAEVAEAIRNTEPVPPRRRVVDLPRDLEWIVLRALEKEAGRRYATAADLGADVHRLLSHEPVVAGPVSATYRLTRFVRRHRGGFAVASMVLVLTAVPLLVGWMQTARQAEARRILLEVEDLTERAREFPPSGPASLPGFEVWLEECRPLEAKLSEYEDLLSSIRLEAEPWSDEEREHDRSTHVLAETLAYCARNLDANRDHIVTLEGALKARPGLIDSPKIQLALSVVRQRVPELEEEVRDLAAAVNSRQTWRFADADRQQLHDFLERQVQRLTTFFDPDTGPFADVSARRDFARTVEERSLNGSTARALWTRATVTIADAEDSPRYEGLHVVPQLGLLPLGPDPKSGLWEFAHLESGEPATRDPETGRLELGEGTGIVLVLLPGRTFLMGAQARGPGNPNYDRQSSPGESPCHPVTLAPFFISKYEMTQAQWRRIAGRNPSHFDARRPKIDGTHPVESVDWLRAREVVQRLGLELPTEAQWEFAARALQPGPWWTGEEAESLRGSSNLADRAAERDGIVLNQALVDRRHDDKYSVHAPVGSFPANPFGLHDVHGNVREWCQDGFGLYALPDEVQVEPDTGRRIGGNPDERMSRGGSFIRGSRSARLTHRARNSPDFMSSDLGLRPARAIDP